MNHPKVVDIRPIRVREKHFAIFRACDDLAAGESVKLVTDHDPTHLYYQFKAERPGQFTWKYMRKGPGVWRVKITRIAGFHLE